jgi:hypothetical protein
MAVAAILAIFSGFSRNKSDASNNLARLCGTISVVLLFSSGVLIAGSLYAAVGVKYVTGYSFTLMAIAQFLSFLAAMLVAHWMVTIRLVPLNFSHSLLSYSRDIHSPSPVKRR